MSAFLSARRIEQRILRLLSAVAVSMLTVVQSASASPANSKRVRFPPSTYYADANGGAVTMIGGRPAGCPSAYCGCALARYLGLRDRRLNLASNWARLFPRTAPHPGAAAVRAGHVMLLQEHVSGFVWRVVDFNGGLHLSWVHERDVRGYVFVEPDAKATALESRFN